LSLSLFSFFRTHYYACFYYFRYRHRHDVTTIEDFYRRLLFNAICHTTPPLSIPNTDHYFISHQFYHDCLITTTIFSLLFLIRHTPTPYHHVTTFAMNETRRLSIVIIFWFLFRPYQYASPNIMLYNYLKSLSHASTPSYRSCRPRLFFFFLSSSLLFHDNYYYILRHFLMPIYYHYLHATTMFALSPSISFYYYLQPDHDIRLNVFINLFRLFTFPTSSLFYDMSLFHIATFVWYHVIIFCHGSHHAHLRRLVFLRVVSYRYSAAF